MSTGKLGPNATLDEALLHLSEPEKYMSRLIKRMRECAEKHGNAYVRLAVSKGATGKYPSFRVIYITISSDEDHNEKVFGSYNDNGTEFESVTSSSPSWSGRCMSLADVIRIRLDWRPENA
jgi:hypothetical protein